MQSPSIPDRDLNAILHATAPLWEEMRGQSLFLSGGTGFFGCWLVESFLYINRLLRLDARATVLTRNPEAFRLKLPHLRDDTCLTLLQGDIRTFRFPETPHTFIIHAATQASAQLVAAQPHHMLSTMLSGTGRILAFAASTGARKLLFTSSGAVYGPQPTHLLNVAEEYLGAPDPLLPASVYGEGKRVAELMCSLAANASLEIKIARCFAFLGPHLPLDTHFAAGNFLADALAGRNIHIASHGSSFRSYLYAADLSIWLWTILFSAPSLRAFNVGSEHAIKIRELAEVTAHIVNPASQVEVALPPDRSQPLNRYVPCTARARNELGLRQTVSLEEALYRTAAWHRLE